jgi:hypothetical protein
VSGRRAAAGPILYFNQLDAQMLEHGRDGPGIIVGHPLQGTPGVKRQFHQ